MVSEDIMHLHASSNLKNNEPPKTCDNIEVGVFIMEDLGQLKEENRGSQAILTDLSQNVSSRPPTQEVELVQSLSVSCFSKVDMIQSDNNGENHALVDQREELGVHEIDGVKRPRAECIDKESSVRVLYSSLPSNSKRKLEELLHHWSEWHAQHCASAKVKEDSVDSLESGEETYFPALHVGSDKSSTVSFSMDVHSRKRQQKESLLLDDNCSPLYDREYAIGLASEGVSEERDLREAPRCFNCSSFNHSLSGCPKPRDNAAVNSARKQHQSKRNQNAGPRVPTRYYQETPNGKFDGLKAGALSAETRKLLGLGELDPPPWLNRMRELGYPPGYLEKEDQPSGITIYDDEDTQNAAVRNDLPFDVQKSQKKMTVDFPGINAPIPENADQNRWAAQGPPCSDFSPSQPNHRQNYARESMNNGHFNGEFRPRNHIEPRPPHFGFGSSPPMPHYPYNHYQTDPFSPRGIPVPPRPVYGRPFDAGRPTLNYNYGSF